MGVDKTRKIAAMRRDSIIRDTVSRMLGQKDGNGLLYTKTEIRQACHDNIRESGLVEYGIGYGLATIQKVIRRDGLW